MQETLLNAGLIQDVNISFTHVILALLISAFCAYAIKLSYVRFGKSLNNRENFSDIFVLLAVVTCIVIIIVKFSLALSLGLVGALSIVRFRAAIKEPEELVYLFLVIAIGLANGANQYIAALLLTAFAVLMIYLGSLRNSRNPVRAISSNILSVKGTQQAFEEWYSDSTNLILEQFSYLSLKELKSSNGRVEAIFQYSLTDTSIAPDALVSSLITQNQELTIQIFTDIIIPE